MKQLRRFLALVMLTGPTLAFAVTVEEHAVTVHLKDGSTLVGVIDKEDERTLTVITTSGVSIEIPREKVKEIGLGPDEAAEAAQRAGDDALFLGPTGRPLPRGTGYVSDHWVFFPGVAYGVTDNITVAGGASLIPGVGADNQVLFFTPKIGTRLGSHASIAAGGLFARASGVTLALPYVASTFGSDAHSLTAGLAFGHASGDGAEGNSGPILLVGGSTRLSRRFSLMSENWIFPEEDFQLFSAGVRIHGDRLMVDIGVIFNKDIVDEGVPVPWLSFSYHFGTRRPRG